MQGMKNNEVGIQVESCRAERTVIRLLRVKQLTLLLGIGRATIYDKLNQNSPRHDPAFPRPVRLLGGASKGGAVAWIESEIYRWIEGRIADGRPEQGVSK